MRPVTPPPPDVLLRPGHSAATPASDRAVLWCCFLPSPPWHLLAAQSTPAPRHLSAWEARAHVQALLALCPQDPPHSRDSGSCQVPEKHMAPRSWLEAPSSNSETTVTSIKTNHHRSLQPCCAEGDTAILGVLLPPIPGREGEESLPCPRRGASHRETGLYSPRGQPPA